MPLQSLRKTNNTRSILELRPAKSSGHSHVVSPVTINNLVAMPVQSIIRSAAYTDKKSNGKQKPSGQSYSPPSVVKKKKVHPKAFYTAQSPQLLLTLDDKRKAVEQALQVIFQCEYHILVEYVECVVPLMYMLHMITLFHFPSLKYCTDSTSQIPAQLERTAMNMLGYASLEVLSFIALHSVIKHKLGISPTHVLSFTLQNQMYEFQARLAVCYMFVLVITLYHCGSCVPASAAKLRLRLTLFGVLLGVDFSFEFEWMQHILDK